MTIETYSSPSGFHGTNWLKLTETALLTDDNTQYTSTNYPFNGSLSDTLYTYKYNFAIPGSSIIEGVAVSANAYIGSIPLNASGFLRTIQLFDLFGNIGYAKEHTSTLTTDQDGIYTVGNATDLWHSSGLLTANVINASGFGVLLNVGGYIGSTNPTAFIDNIVLTVWYTESGVLSSSNMDLFIAGGGYGSGTTDLYIGGPIESSGTVDLFIGGPVIESGLTPLYIAGPVEASGNTTLYISGPVESSGSTTLYISGPLPSSGIMPLYVKGGPLGPEMSGLTPLYLFSTTNSGVERSCELFLKNSDEFDNRQAMNLYMVGPESYSNTGSMNLFLKNSNESSGILPLYIANAYTLASGGQPLFIAAPSGTMGAIPSSGTMNLFISRENESDAHRLTLFISAPELSSGLIPLYIAGETTSTNSLELFMSGVGSSTSTLRLYSHGW